MVKSCAAYNCNSRYGKAENVSFHLFPKKPELRLKWITATKRDNFIPSKYSYLCSKHFEKSCFNTKRLGGLIVLKKDALPTLFEHEEDQIPISSEPVAENVQQKNKNKRFSFKYINKQEKNEDFQISSKITSSALKENLPITPKEKKRKSSYLSDHVTEVMKSSKRARHKRNISKNKENTILNKSKSEDIEIKDETIPLPAYELTSQETEDPLNIEIETGDVDFYDKDMFCSNEVQSENMLQPLVTILLPTIRSDDLIDENEDPLNLL